MACGMMEALKISLCIIAIHECTQEGMIFYRVRAFVATIMDRLFGDRRSEWLQMPLWGCVICMASCWGVVFSMVLGVAWSDVPVTILMVCGINVLFSRVINNQYNENRF
jgi:hypothetical protein